MPTTAKHYVSGVLLAAGIIVIMTLWEWRPRLTPHFAIYCAIAVVASMLKFRPPGSVGAACRGAFFHEHHARQRCPVAVERSTIAAGLPRVVPVVIPVLPDRRGHRGPAASLRSRHHTGAVSDRAPAALPRALL